MRAEVYDATQSIPPTGRLEDKPHMSVPIGPDWSTTDVLSAAGLMSHPSFALVTPEIEADVAVGTSRSVSYSGTLLGVDEDGCVWYPRGRQILWVDFLRAVQEGFFVGDPTRIVAYPFRVAGGWEPDGLWAAVQYLFDNREAVVDAWAVTASINGFSKVFRVIGDQRRKAIARQWDRQGFTAPRLRRVLNSREAWDPERLAARTSLTVGEATSVLVNTGYEPGADGLFRLSDDPAAQSRAAGYDEIEREASRRGPQPQRDWPEDDDGDP